MKNKVVFFILGALVATIAYFAGDFEPLTAQEDKPTKSDYLDYLKVGLLEVDTAIFGLVGNKGRIQIGTNAGFPRIRLEGPNGGDVGLWINAEGAPTLILQAKGEDSPAELLVTVDEDSGHIELIQGGEDFPNIKMFVNEKSAGVGYASQQKRPESQVKIVVGGKHAGLIVESPEGSNVLVPK